MKNSTFEILLTRFIVIALFIGVISTMWDVWWHSFVGRETLFEPPHIFLYASITIAIIGGVYGWYRVRERVWKRLAIILLVVPATAPFDEWWHRLFGVEDLSTPLIVWAPPHIALITSITIAWLLLLPLIRKEKDIHAQRLFGSMVFAAILISAMGMATPFQPLGPYAVIGFWGAGILAAIFSGVILVAQRWIPGIGGAITATVFFLLLYSIGFESKEAAPGIIIQPHAHPPTWLITFSFLIPAAFIALVKQPPYWIRGALAGGLWAGILYGFAFMFIEPEFRYGVGETTIMVGTSLLGGIVGGVFASFIRHDKEPTSGSKESI